MTCALPRLSRLMTRRTSSIGTLLAEACLVMRNSRSPFGADGIEPVRSCAVAGDASVTASNAIPIQTRRNMSAPDFVGDGALVTVKLDHNVARRIGADV